MVITTLPCEPLHNDLYGPMRVRSIIGKSYILVTADDFSRFTWVDLLKEKGETMKPFSKFWKELQMLLNLLIVFVRSDHGREFTNKSLALLWRNMKQLTTSELLKHHNKMVWLKGKIAP